MTLRRSATLTCVLLAVLLPAAAGRAAAQTGPEVAHARAATAQRAAVHRATARRTVLPDPGPSVRSSRVLSATVAAAADGSSQALSLRLVVNPVTGVLCSSLGTGGAAAGGASRVLPAGSTLSLTATDGSRVTLVDGSAVSATQQAVAGSVCTDAVNPAVAAALLAAPAAYPVTLTDGGGDQASGALASAPAAARPWPVGVRTEVVVDPTRSTARRGAVRAARSRTLRLRYWYPARTGTVGTADGSGAPASAEGPFPVVVFSPGYAVTPQTYERTLHAWAAAGYVVVGVLSPGSGGGLPGTPTESDLSAQPGDLSVALTAVSRHAADPVSWLGGVADLTRVAVAGHSDGGSTAAAAGLLRRYADPRIDAAIVMAGADLGGAPVRRTVPLLLLSGQDDQYNRPSTFARVYSLAHGTRTWVQALGATHLTPFVVDTPQAAALRDLEVAFLDRSLYGAPDAATERRLATTRGLTRIAAGRF